MQYLIMKKKINTWTGGGGHASVLSIFGMSGQIRYNVRRLCKSKIVFLSGAL